METSKNLLDRLADVLPVFEAAAEASAVEAQRQGESWEFPKRLKSNITLLMYAIESLRPHFGTKHLKSETGCRNTLTSISKALNSLIADKTQAKFPKVAFPGLAALRDHDDPVALLPHFEERIHSAWIETTDGWISELKHMLPRRSSNQRPSHSVYDLATTLYRALEKALKSKCACSRPHHSLLFMANHRGFSEGRDATIVFDMLISTPESMERRWCDTQVKVPVLAEGNVDRFQRKAARKTLDSICSSFNFLAGVPVRRATLFAQEGSLVEDRANKRVRLGTQSLFSPTIVTLNHLLETLSGGPKLSFRYLTQLAIHLATSFLHLYGGPWMPHRLGADMVQFICTPDGLLLIPFLPFVPSQLSPPGTEDLEGKKPLPRMDFDLSRPARVGLGVLLFELFTQTVYPTKLPDDGSAIAKEDLWNIIFDIDDTLEEWKDEENFGLVVDAINACFDMGTNSLPGEFEECESFYETVISPLEEQLIRENSLSDQRTENISPDKLDTLTFQEVLVPIALPQAIVPISTPAISPLSAPIGSLKRPTRQQESDSNLANGSTVRTRTVPKSVDSRLDAAPTAADTATKTNTPSHVSPAAAEVNHSEESEAVLDKISPQGTSLPPESRGAVDTAASQREEHASDSPSRAVTKVVQETDTAVERTARKGRIKYKYTKYLDYLAGMTKSADVKDAASWLKDFVEIEELVFRFLEAPKVPPRPIKLAILDTGCSLDTGFFDKEWHHGDKDRVAGEHWKDCLGDHPDGPIDEDPNRHGTKITTLLLMLLPRVELFIARVARTTSDFESPKAQQAVAEASVLVVSICAADGGIPCCIAAEANPRLRHARVQGPLHPPMERELDRGEAAHDIGLLRRCTHHGRHRSYVPAVRVLEASYGKRRDRFPKRRDAFRTRRHGEALLRDN
ncbi:hypothetical protein M406DRAFT_75863 [Cryphonectria parasitica EP155]|uniref:DUF7580 domain-containing protein n=1 Tax=Cryphonectria parasitica (strain ATCC 38755 / EP155) TaxID=660469 RepID=A0A9P5CS95_CRYP1|nr:uncharacterized protein M406DRAFT_75863 [Cryphonectria parasitica EP155]KAF3769384.1 hypothetical protein M406DRAFT_75863 [Cryphonectria parasitica EP155]